MQMISDEDYVKKIMQQVLESYTTIYGLNDNSGDLEIIKKELLKINGFLNVILKKCSASNFQSKEISGIQPKIKNYLDSYYFVQEIDTMSPLYSDDSSRIKNMRLKILDAFQDKKLIDRLQEIVENW